MLKALNRAVIECQLQHADAGNHRGDKMLLSYLDAMDEISRRFRAKLGSDPMAIQTFITAAKTQAINAGTVEPSAAGYTVENKGLNRALCACALKHSPSNGLADQVAFREECEKISTRYYEKDPSNFTGSRSNMPPYSLVTDTVREFVAAAISGVNIEPPSAV